MIFSRQNVVRLLNSSYLRITLSRVTTSFFLLSFIFFIAQVLIQAFLWTDDNSAFKNINAMVENGGAPSSLLPWLDIKKEHFNLRICSEAPYGAKNVSQVCPTVFDTNDAPNSSWVPPPVLRSNGTLISGPEQVKLANGSDVSLSEQCLYTLMYPTKRLRTSMNEELALLFSQFWLLGLSSAAVLSRSVSHIIAVFAMRVLSTGWSAYTIWRTKDLDNRLFHLIVNEGRTPCHSDFGIFPNYIKMRIALQIPDLILNVCALLFTGLLGYRLIKTFSENVFNCVGPPAKIGRLYRYMLTVVVSGQLLIYLLIASISLVLIEGIISKAKLLAMDITLFVLTVILTVIMVTLGYHSTRYERKRLMIAFLILLACLIIGFLAMFTLPAFQFTWIQWPFFACISGVNAAVLICSATFAALCRIHFGEGLKHYLHVENVLSKADFQPDEFSTGQEAKLTSASRVSFFVQEAMPTEPVITRNTNWDFEDQTRPPIYTVEARGE
ncbi:hypothetical protein BDY19DRAFT_996665 [Irpex rosettiformis]|uniref:Uncharacterized protein n=1 Tax=Irpex rosettiformis TaxID=378272 RepID=A0ACB8TU40_9APHY|nr:hypothetical protein BDY19DRAFT_996665 [Irpex rosettiformis]